MKANKFLLYLLSALLLASCSQNSQNKTKKDQDTNENVPVKLIQVEKRSINPKVAAHGIVTTNEDIRLSFNIPGRIKRIFIKEGDAVRRGQVIAELDLTEVDAQLNQTTEGYIKTVRDYSRLQNLYADSVITLEQLQNAETAMNVAKQSLDIITYNRSHSIIEAPSNGVVLMKMYNEGEYVGPGTPVCMISSDNNRNYIVKTSVSAKDRLKINNEDKADIQIEGFENKIFKGKIKHISQNVDYINGLYTIEIQLMPEKEKVAIGLFSKIEIIPRKTIEYYVLPLGCLTEGENNTAYVYVPKDSSRVDKIGINIDFIEEDMAYIKTGLENIREVVYGGAGFLSETSTISIK